MAQPVVVGVIPGVMTVYDWNGERHHATESRASLHTSQRLSAVVLDRIAAEHPFEIPGTYVLAAISAGSYVGWVANQTRFGHGGQRAWP